MTRHTLTLEGCAGLYSACRALARDFHVQSDGVCVSFRGEVRGTFYVSACRVKLSLGANILALHDLLLRAHALLAEAGGISPS